jgi:hypothetical protein
MGGVEIMTRDDLLAMLVKKKITKTSLTWAQFGGVVTAASLAIKAQILEAINTNKTMLLVDSIMNLVNTKKRELAETDINNMAVDDLFSTTVLLDLLS